MSTIFEELARRLRRTDLLLLRAVRRQRARPSMRAKGQFWGSVITDDEVDALLRAHGEIDYLTGPDGLEDAVAASTAMRDATDGRFARLRRAFDLDGDDADLILLCTPVGQLRELTRQMLPALRRGAIVTDVGSVKGSVVRLPNALRARSAPIADPP